MVHVRYCNVLDDGFVGLIDVMGSDAEIAAAARISHATHKNEKSDEENRNLIRYLMRHGHTSPFEMAELKFHIRVPIYVWRQWIRHRTASVNEVSGRYTILKESFHRFGPDEWRYQSSSNKQGSEGQIPENIGKPLTDEQNAFLSQAYGIYLSRLAQGVSREQARKDLPLSIYTEAYWKIDLHNLLRFLKLRLDEHAQKEIREYAKVIAGFVAELFPLTWEAFLDYVLNAITFSTGEQKVIACLLADWKSKISSLLEENHVLTQREKQELIAKLDRLV